MPSRLKIPKLTPNKIGSMRKYALILLAILCTACTTDTTQTIDYQTLKVGFDASSRVVLNQQGETVWNSNDLLSVFYRSTVNEPWQFTGADGDSSGEFMRQCEPSEQTTSQIVALYPYDESATLTALGLNLTIPATQHYHKDSYGRGDNVMVGISQSDNLTLQNLCGYLRLSFVGTKSIKSITLTGNNNEVLAGQALVNTTTLNALIVNNKAQAITLDCSEGVTLSHSATTFHIALAPQTFEQGITITVQCADGSTAFKSTKKRVDIARNHILPMALIDCDAIIVTPSAEREALIDLYNATNGSSWSNTTNWCSQAPISEWFGVECDASGNLIGLNLAANNLSGSLPDSFTELMDCCNYLIVGQNNLTGAVSQSIISHNKWQYLWGDILSGTQLEFNMADIPFPEFEMKDTDTRTIDSATVCEGKKGVVFYGWDEYTLNDILAPVYDSHYTYSGKLAVIGWTTEHFYRNYTLQGGYAVFPWKTYPQLVESDKNSIRPHYGFYPTASLPSVTIFNDKKQLVYSTCLCDNVTEDDIYDAIDSLFVSSEYTSTDYSEDGEVEVLQTATEGNGIDIVLMGDGYSDRLIADGTYDKTMRQAMEALFSEEPYRSFRHLFNVYAVTAVSPNESFGEGCRTALSSYFGQGTHVGGDDPQAMSYALCAINQGRLNNSTIVIMLNSPRYAGTCYMYYPDGYSQNHTFNNDHGQGLSVSYFPVGTDYTALSQVLTHEACGHGFAKLADEYAYIEMGKIPYSEMGQVERMQQFGWYMNIDLYDDPEICLWSHFLADARYKNEGLGLFEGGYTYWSGVWRPTYNSIMRHNTDGFNAPSRERIYYRIHKLAYGVGWQYDYEQFVAFDQSTRAKSAARPNSLVLKPFEHTPPVVRPYSALEALTSNRSRE